jgi:hypothetical protein
MHIVLFIPYDHRPVAKKPGNPCLWTVILLKEHT